VRILRLGLAVTLASCVSQPTWAQAPLSAEAFLGQLGINTHIGYTDGRYLNAADVVEKLNYLGVTRVRDHTPNPAYDPVGQRNYARVALAGIRFNLVVNGNTEPAVTVARIEALEKTCPGAVVAIEGPNEIVHSPVHYQGLSGDAAASALQLALYKAVRASPDLADLPVYSYSLDTDSKPAGGFDFAALHPYPQNGDQPLRWLHNESRLAPSGARLVLTESGYSTLPSWWMGVDQEAQARLTLNLLFDAALTGINGVYLYELLDAYADPGMADGGKHYGLFDYSGKPKPAASAIHNLTTILGRYSGPLTAAPAPKSPFRVQGLPSTAASLTLQGGGGETIMVLWNEPDIWDQSKPARRTIPASPISVTVDAPSGRLEIYDPLASADPLPIAGSRDRLDLGLSDRPIIIVMRPQDTGKAKPPAARKPRPCSAGWARMRAP
jgi:hypothetical protein